MKEVDNNNNIENKIEDRYYTKLLLPNYITIPVLMICLFLGFFLYFSVKSKVVDLIEEKLAKAPCPIQHENVTLDLFLPQLKFTSLQFSESCLGTKRTINMKEVKLKLRGIKLFPLGLKFKLSSHLIDTMMNVNIIVSSSNVYVEFENSVFDLGEIVSYFDDLPVDFKGKIRLKGTSAVNIKSNKLMELDLDFNGSELDLPKQNISGFHIPNINIGSLDIKLDQFLGNKNKNEINISRFLLGNKDAAIEASFMGTINISYDKPSSSKLNVSGGLRLSEEIKNKFSLILLFLKKFPLKDNFYQMKINGTFDKPSLNPSN